MPPLCSGTKYIKARLSETFGARSSPRRATRTNGNTRPRCFGAQPFLGVRSVVPRIVKSDSMHLFKGYKFIQEIQTPFTLLKYTFSVKSLHGLFNHWKRDEVAGKLERDFFNVASVGKHAWFCCRNPLKQTKLHSCSCLGATTFRVCVGSLNSMSTCMVSEDKYWVHVYTTSTAQEMGDKYSYCKHEMSSLGNFKEEALISA